MATTNHRSGTKNHWHPFHTIGNKKIQLVEGEDVFLCCEFVSQICEEPCRDVISGHKYKVSCSCLSILIGSDERQAAVARYMASFATKPPQEKHSIVVEWLRYTKSAAKNNADGACFFIPFLAPENDENDDSEGEDDEEDDNDARPLDILKDWMVCRHAIAVLIDYGRKKWRTCQAALAANRLPIHGNKGKTMLGPSKHVTDEVKGGLHDFFHEIKQFGMPKTTRFVREETGSGLRDEEENLLELPTCWSKRSIYARFCYERGFVITNSGGGIKKQEERTDEAWGTQQHKKICSWPTFLYFWKTHYPLIQIASPSADICTDCHIFFNRAKYNAPPAPGAPPNIEQAHDTRPAQFTNYCEATRTNSVEQGEGANDDDEPYDLQLVETQNVELIERESSLLKATLHVKQAMIQRKLTNTKIQQAIDTMNLPHEERHYCFIADFSQNMELPFFGSSQPGDTYYFSALKINVFGIVDCSIFGGKLSAHVYHEGVGKKGGNNVASMLVKEFKRLSIMQENKTGKELTIIMDNCAGQNKNRMVLRLANYLVEANYFEKVSFVFYIVGHTKNACDRWFNTLKKNYRRRNIYSFNQLIDSMKTNPNINVTITKEEDFKDWDAFFNSVYKKLVSGTTHKTHIFSAEKENKTTLLLRDDDLPETPQTTQDLLKKGTNTPERYASLRTPQLVTLAPPGIPPIKQVELFSKYRALIPVQFQEETCPDPGEDIKGSIKRERNTEQRDRQKAKRLKCENDKKTTTSEDTARI